MDVRERLEALEASHVRLMTDHELFLKEQELAWEKHQAFMAEHREFVAERDRAWQRQQERWVKIDERIDKLVSGLAHS
jgi:hypothetical protein